MPATGGLPWHRARSLLPVIWFGGGDADLAASPIDLVHTVGINEYNGTRNVQLTYMNSRAG